MFPLSVHSAQAHRPAEVVLRRGGRARRARQREGQVGRLRPGKVRQGGAQAHDHHQHGQLRQDLQHGEYRVSHLLVDLGWVDFDFCVPPTCPAASAKFPSAKAELSRQWNTQNLSQPDPVYYQIGHWKERRRMEKVPQYPICHNMNNHL